MTAGIAGMIAGIAEMTAGIGDRTAGTIDGIVEMIGGITTGKSRKAFATGWTGDRETLARTGVSIPITPAIIATATVITAKDSVEAMLGASASTPTTGDSNRRNAYGN